MIDFAHGMSNTAIKNELAITNQRSEEQEEAPM